MSPQSAARGQRKNRSSHPPRSARAILARVFLV
jgi:hypothetical protein